MKKTALSLLVSLALLAGCSGGSGSPQPVGGGGASTPQTVLFQPQVTVTINLALQAPMTGSTVRLVITP